MRVFIHYLRSLFCKHEFEYEETIFDRYDDGWGGFKENVEKVSRTCKKCGWHKSYWKY